MDNVVFGERFRELKLFCSAEIYVNKVIIYFSSVKIKEIWFFVKFKMSKVLQLYRQLHRTTKIVFKDDFASIGTVSAKIRGEFEKNRNVKNEAAIEELLKFGQESDEILRKFVLQIEQVDETTYRTHIR